MATQHNHNRQSAEAMIDPRSAAAGGALVAMLLVGGIITYGYSNYAAALRPGLHPFATVLIGLVFSAIAIVLARAVATTRLLAVARGEPGNRWAGIGWFLPLLLISALGAINSLFYMFETDDVVNSRMAIVRQQFTALNTQGREALRHSEIERVRTEILTHLQILEQRIVRGGGTPNSCGIGSDARGVIQEIATTLPGYRQIPRYEGLTACSSHDRLKRLYKEQEDDAWTRFKALPVYTLNRGADRDKLVDHLDEATKKHLGSLQNRAVQSREQLIAVQETLREAADPYAELKSAIELTSGKKLDLPDTLDIDDALTIGNAGHVIKNLAKRMHHLQTWIYIIVALAVDAWLVYAILNLLNSYVGTSAMSSSRNGSKESEDALVRYLWDELTA